LIQNPLGLKTEIGSGGEKRTGVTRKFGHFSIAIFWAGYLCPKYGTFLLMSLRGVFLPKQSHI
jgi:hypothetical protein